MLNLELNNINKFNNELSEEKQETTGTWLNRYSVSPNVNYVQIEWYARSGDAQCSVTNGLRIVFFCTVVKNYKAVNKIRRRNNNKLFRLKVLNKQVVMEVEVFQ